MKLDYCVLHRGAVLDGQDLNCLAIRHDNGAPAKPAEVWAEMERLRAEEKRLHSVVTKANLYADHLGIRLGEVIRERDALANRLAASERADAALCQALNEGNGSYQP